MRNTLKLIAGLGLFGMVCPVSLHAVTVAEAQAQLKSKDVIKRRGAVQDLVNLRSPETAPVFLQALKDTDPYVRTLAVRGLGYMHWTAAGSSLADLLANDPSTEVRQSSALSLRFLNDPSRIPALAKAVKDPAKPVRLTAIASLGAFHEASALPALTEAAKEADLDIRRTAILALGQVGDPSSAALLIAALKDEDGPTRANAALTLANLPGKEGIPELQEALKDPSAQVHLSAARSLAIKGNHRGYDLALAALKSMNPADQMLAMDTLGFIQDKNAIPALEGLLKSKNAMIKQGADQAIKRIIEKKK